MAKVPPSPLIELLISAGADKVVHDVRKGKVRRTLLHHLKGVERLLRESDYSQPLCTAGLLHSVYGTNRFTRKTIDPDLEGERERLRASAGEEAERLAYLFHAIDRPRVLHELVKNAEGHRERGQADCPPTPLPFATADSGVGLEGRDGEILMLSEREAWQLVALEIANLLEQGELHHDKWPYFAATEAYQRINPVAQVYRKEFLDASTQSEREGSWCSVS